MFDAVLRSWPIDPWLWATLSLTAAVYLRGWLSLRRRDARWHAGQPAAFLGGLACVFLALGSPVESFAGMSLQIHMLQHLLLAMAAPPLLWLGAPLLPMLRGLPKVVRRDWLGPLLHAHPLRRFLAWLTHPLVALPLFTAAFWLWHIPAAYELALRSRGWHYAQHASFLIAALVFWHVVVRPYPNRPRWSAWLLIPFLLLADVQNTVLSALLTFSDRVLYPHYLRMPPIFGQSALADQAAAGVLMWVPGSAAFLLPLFAIGIRQLYGGSAATTRKPAATIARRPTAPRTYVPLPVVPSRNQTPPRTDVLRWPIIGAFLRWPHARKTLQWTLLAAAALIVLDGLLGPRAAPMNLAGVAPWIHWRGLVVIGLLAAGNIACMACPFTLPRRLASRWLPAPRAWPTWLRNKWLAVGLLVLFFWAYEALSLWDRPWWTAWIIVGYFVAAFAVESFFGGGTFCKHVCPIGQFNFIQSLVSPLSIGVREPAACHDCRTHDCLHGRAVLPGCELKLFAPQKVGNLDCTFCLDCVTACPKQNIGLMPVWPGVDLSTDRRRAGIGRLSERPDLVALVLLLVFAAFVNAAGMVGPAVHAQDQLTRRFGWSSPMGVVSLGYVLGLFVIPAALVGGAAWTSRALGRELAGLSSIIGRYAWSLVPIGFAMWLAHYSFHFLTTADAIVPVVQRAAADIGLAALGRPTWGCGCCVPTADWLLRLELLMLGCGLLGSLHVAWSIASSGDAPASWAVRSFLPWGGLIMLLFAVGVWVMLQPMQMRGLPVLAGGMS